MSGNVLYLKILFQFGMETFLKVFKNSFSARKIFSPSSNTSCVFCSLFSEGKFSSQHSSLVSHPLYWCSKYEGSNSYIQTYWMFIANHGEVNPNPGEFCENWNYYFLIFPIFIMEILSFAFFFGCAFQLDCKFLEKRILQGCIFLQCLTVHNIVTVWCPSRVRMGKNAI